MNNVAFGWKSPPCVRLGSGVARTFAAIVTVVGLSFAWTAAEAADLPSHAAPSVFDPAPAWSWTGLYIGVNGGGSVDHAAYPFNGATSGMPGYIGFSGYTERGPLAGGQIGYNMQFRDVPIIGRPPVLNGYSFLDHLVAGVEVDSDWSNINGTNTAPLPLGPVTVGVRIKNFGVARARLGYSFDRLLLYVYTGASYATTQSYFNAFGFTGSQSVTRFPARLAAYGVGAEYMLSNKWSVRAEYMYDYIAATYPFFDLGPGTNVGFQSRTSFHVVRGALNYHFDMFGAAPVAARY